MIGISNGIIYGLARVDGLCIICVINVFGASWCDCSDDMWFEIARKLQFFPFRCTLAVVIRYKVSSARSWVLNLKLAFKRVSFLFDVTPKIRFETIPKPWTWELLLSWITYLELANVSKVNRLSLHGSSNLAVGLVFSRDSRCFFQRDRAKSITLVRIFK